MDTKEKIIEVLKTLLFMFGIPFVLSSVLIAAGATASLNKGALEVWQQVPLLMWWIFCIECGLLVTGVFIYSVATGKLFER